MKYIVTGGAGFIGSHIAEALAGKHEVVIIDDLFSGKMQNLKDFRSSVHFVQGSITNLPLIKEIFASIQNPNRGALDSEQPRWEYRPADTSDAFRPGPRAQT